ncbi:MAG TPA: methyl-accepting chemotaxis protein, partial [Albitalea sp.]|nr:methyl-accepting chemotaxis protein [Albitalea sp.]
MNLTQFLRRFTIRTRMLCAIAMVAAALAGVGAVGMAGPLLGASTGVALAIAVAVALVIITPLTLANMNSICEPIRNAERLADAITKGDLTEQQIDTSGQDEAARLLKALASMQGSLRNVVGQVRASTDSISNASTEIASGN